MSSSCVIDASAAVCNLIRNQATAAADAFFESAQDAWVAPNLMSLEIRNTLVRLERRGLLVEGAADADLMLLESRIVFAPAPGATALVRIAGLARQLVLGVYDAVYLDLAARHGAALASRDAALLGAAERVGVVVNDLR